MEFSDELKKQIILAAASSVKANEFTTKAQIDEQIAKEVCRFASYLGERSVFSRILGCTRIFARIEKVVFEESSKRFVITFCPRTKDGYGEPEIVRTDRLDGQNAEFVKRFVNPTDVENIVGKLAYIYKETVPDATNASKSYRQTPFIYVL